ncbi:flagellar brake domain-containing protein [Bacillus sp. V3B]|uniref:flagellar brake protein n=1 Tax=Bacillus sp. V3B TaxID=2804915 RepID=UPI00210D7E33|nr:flagellar brake domain-containing protein [Bacillus sp. V3B]MCQ6273858.1 flagellar brake domain-containing protein [Bacillus sp. V3B]
MLTIGQNLILELKHTHRTDQYKCRLVERKGNTLFIDYPIHIKTNRTMFLVDGTQLKVSFVEGTSVYLFETEILGRLMQEIPMMKLIYPGDEYLMKIQRRQFVRVETAVDVAIHPMNHEFEPFTTITEDISAGGSLVNMNKQCDLKQGSKIRTVFVLPLQNGEYHYLKLTSEVIRLMEKKETGQTQFSLRFIDVTPQQRQLLLHFSFDRQIAMKKKGFAFNE